MSIKALTRRARETRYWLGQACLPLWADVGVVRAKGFVSALEMNHRPDDDGPLADDLGHAGMAALFELAPRVGFDPDFGAELAELATAALQGRTPPTLTSEPGPSGARSLAGQCANLRALLLDATRSSSATSDAVAAFDVLMDEYLTPEGGWIAGYDTDGQPSRSDMPAFLGRDVARALGPMLALVEA
ncbi:MAG: hypothetical protein AAF216_03100 [Pseudomonadota bacterium]